MQISKSFPLIFIQIAGGGGIARILLTSHFWSAGALLSFFPQTSKLFRGNEQPVCLLLACSGTQAHLGT